jgi:ferrous iron transport protein B
MDKLMHKIGLHGKSFIPLIMGFGCNVPAIMSTRTIENPKNRLLTILINPFMSCSARLPVYILFLGAFFPGNAGLMLFVIYAIGILLAVGVAFLFKNTLFKSDEIPFVMELPPYRMPTLKSTLLHMWHKGEQYLMKMGGVILTASIIIWALGYFPRNRELDKKYTQKIEQVCRQYDSELAITKDTQVLDSIQKLKSEAVSRLNLERTSEHQEQSFIGLIGKTIEPVMRPLGFDWKISVSLLTGIAAKEVVVSTTGVLYQAQTGDQTHNLGAKLQQQTFTNGDKKGLPVFTKVTVIALIMFVLIYFPCVAVMAAMRKETGSWKWPLFVVFYTTLLAWIVALGVQTVGAGI